MDQQWNVLPPLAQRRYFDGKDPQPIKKIFAKLVIADHAFQIAMCGGNQTDIDLNGFRTSKPFELLLLESPQQLWLKLKAYVADLVQKKASVVCQFESPPFLHQGARESALFVAKQFAFHQT
jgi:hypothetical protein